MKRLTTEEFIKKAKEVHGDKYDYSKVEYVNAKLKVCIICPIHGEFWQTPSNHLDGKGCIKCGGNCKIGRESFIEKSMKIHKNRYDYSKVTYVNISTKVCIICPIHGEFWQKPSNHLLGRGCPECDRDSISRCNTVYKEGYVAFNPDYGFYVIKKRTKNGNVLIRFLNNGFEKEYDIRSISSNNIKNPLTPKVYGVGYLGENCYNIKYISKDISYRKWVSMLCRCYNTKKINKPYKDCTVCNEWHNFSIFKEWFDKNYVDGWELDKDLFSKGNKIYSPDTCCFLPLEINRYLASLKSRNKYLLGVYFDKVLNKFESHITINGKNKFLGRFETEDEAYQAYKFEKKKELKRVADKYKDCLDEKIYNAIINKDF